MAKKEPEKPPQIMITEEVKERWALIPEEERSLLMAEYARLTLDETKNVHKKISSIESWVQLFGILALLSVGGSICYFLYSLFGF